MSEPRRCGWCRSPIDEEESASSPALRSVGAYVCTRCGSEHLDVSGVPEVDRVLVLYSGRHPELDVIERVHVDGDTAESYLLRTRLIYGGNLEARREGPRRAAYDPRTREVITWSPRPSAPAALAWVASAPGRTAVSSD